MALGSPSLTISFWGVVLPKFLSIVRPKVTQVYNRRPKKHNLDNKEEKSMGSEGSNYLLNCN